MSISFDHIIIGGGISGLYYGYQLYKKNIPFIILEKGSYERGRLFSSHIEPGNNLIELGASLIHTKQEKMMNLLKELNIFDDLQEISKKQASYYIYRGMDSTSIKKKWKELKKFVKSNIDKVPDDSTMEEASKLLLSKEDYDLYSICWPEWYEVNLQNAKVFFNQEDKEGEYCTFKNGVEQIVKKLSEILKDHIYYCYNVYKIKKISNSSLPDENTYKIYIKNKSSLICKNIFLAVSYTCATNYIKYENLNQVVNYLDCGFQRCCYRFYVEFDTPINIFSETSENKKIPIGYIIGDFQSKWSIKINDYLWMITYVDGPLSCKLNKVDPKKLIKNWIKTLNKEFSLNLCYKNVISYKGGFWKDAYTVLHKKFYNKNSITSNKYYGELCRDLLPKGCTVAILPNDLGENTAWMESVLINP